MKKFWVWLQTEYKRAASALPAALGKAVVLLGLAGMTAFCAQKMQAALTDREPVRIGYAAEESPLIRMAVSYVESMEAVKGLCRLVPMEEEEGRALLEEGELAAFLVLPKGMIEGILTGSNEPAALYLADNPSPSGLVFEELADAATGMLAVAQAEIYAAHALTEVFGVEAYGLTQMYQKLDTFNLGIVMNREQYFRIRQLSETGNTGFAVYYAGAFLTVYLLVAGMLLGGVLKRGREEMRLLKKRGGISYAAQFLGRSIVAACCLLPLLCAAGLMWLWGGVREALRVSWSVQGLFLVLAAVFCAAAWLLFVHLLAESARAAILPAGLAAVVMCYASGCFVPSAILPRVVNRLALILPTTYMKEAFTALFSGSAAGFLKTMAMLLLFFLAFWSGSSAVMRLGGGRRLHTGETQKSGRTKKGYSLFWILGKRLLRKKTIWICLAGMVLLSGLLYNLEKRSDTVITAALYTPDAGLQELISEYDGLVRFLVCSDAEEVKRNVMRGNAECGYVLQEDLQDKILEGNGAWSIEVYEKVDSTMTRVVNEVLFGRIFYAISAGWFEGYIAESEMFAGVLQEEGEEVLRQEAGRQLVRELSDGGTFYFEKVRFSGTEILQESRTEEEDGTGTKGETGTKDGIEEEDGTGTKGGQESVHTAYPTKAVAAAGVILCGVIGVLEALQDMRRKRFRGKTAFWARIYTVLQPVLCGAAAGLLVLAATGRASAFGGAAAGLLVLAAVVFLAGSGAVCLMKRLEEG